MPLWQRDSLSEKEPDSSQALGTALHPQCPLLQRHQLFLLPRKVARGGSGGHNPVKHLFPPKMAPPFPLASTEAFLGCPCSFPHPKRIKDLKTRVWKIACGRQGQIPQTSIPCPHTSRGHPSPPRWSRQGGWGGGIAPSHGQFRSQVT